MPAGGTFVKKLFFVRPLQEEQGITRKHVSQSVEKKISKFFASSLQCEALLFGPSL